MFIPHTSLVINGIYVGAAVGLTLLLYFALGLVTTREDENEGARYSALRDFLRRENGTVDETSELEDGSAEALAVQ